MDEVAAVVLSNAVQLGSLSNLSWFCSSIFLCNPFPLSSMLGFGIPHRAQIPTLHLLPFHSFSFIFSYYFSVIAQSFLSNKIFILSSNSSHSLACSPVRPFIVSVEYMIVGYGLVSCWGFLFNLGPKAGKQMGEEGKG